MRGIAAIPGRSCRAALSRSKRWRAQSRVGSTQEGASGSFGEDATLKRFIMALQALDEDGEAPDAGAEAPRSIRSSRAGMFVPMHVKLEMRRAWRPRWRGKEAHGSAVAALTARPRSALRHASSLSGVVSRTELVSR